MKLNIKLRQISFISIMSSINILFVILNLIFPFFNVFLFFSVPFFSAITALKCQRKYILLYILTTLIISILFDFQTTIFQIFPFLMKGLLFGYLIHKKIHGFYIINLLSLFGILFECLSFFLINYLYQVNILETFQNLLNLSKDKFISISLSFFYFFSLIPNLIIFCFLESELPKLNYKIVSSNSIFVSLIFNTSIINISSWFFVFFLPILGHLLTCISLTFAIYLSNYLITGSNKKIKLLLRLHYIVFLFLSVFFFTFFKKFSFSLLFNFFVSITSYNSFIFALHCKIHETKINHTLFDKTEELEEY